MRNKSFTTINAPSIKSGSSHNIAVILFFIVLFALSGCAKTPEVVTNMATEQEISVQSARVDESRLAQIQSAGVLRVGTALTEPFEYHDPETDELIGFDVDIASRIAAALDVELQWVEMPFANLIPALQEQKVDMTIAAMYITPEREDAVDFAEPYINTGLVMAVRPALAGQVKIVDDLTGLNVGVKIGSTGAQLAYDLVNSGMALTVLEYKDTFDSLLDLEVGRVDVVLNDYLNTIVYIKDTGSKISIAADESGEVNYLSWVGLGIAVSAGETELLSVINDTLTTMQMDGTMDQLYQTWLQPSADR